MLIYAWVADAKTHYYLSEVQAQQAFDAVALSAAEPEWLEPCDLFQLLESKDEVLDKFSKRIAFLELQLEQEELGIKESDFNLG